MSEEECKECRAHGRIEEGLDGIKEWEKEAKATLKHIVTAKVAWSFFVVFLTVCMAVVGFIWHGQVSIANRVDAGLKETMTGVNRIDNKMSIIEYKVDKHLEETNDLKKVLKEKKNGK